MADGGPYHVDATFHDDGRLVSALIWLDGLVPGRLVVDTTADWTLDLRAVLVQAGLRPFVVSIDQTTAPQYRPEGVALGPFWLRFPLLLGIDVLPTDLPDDPAIDGVLGMDWLTPHFARVCFDTNLDQLPRPHGFTLSVFPIKWVDTTAAPVRAVAIVEA